MIFVLLASPDTALINTCSGLYLRFAAGHKTRQNADC